MGPEWQGKELVLVLDHINGIHSDNRLNNLRLLCPNCNSQTSTFAGRNTIYRKKNVYCNSCFRILKYKNKNTLCSDCFNIKRRIVERPSKELLQKELWEIPTSILCKKYNVSDTAIAKWAKAYGISKPPRGY